MWYRGYPYRRRWHRHSLRGFPFMLFFIIAIASHSFAGFLIGIGIAIALSILLTALFRANSVNTPPMAQPYYQPPQQPNQAYYQPYQSDQSYEQGYQPQPTKYQEAEPQYQYPQG